MDVLAELRGKLAQGPVFPRNSSPCVEDEQIRRTNFAELR
jgi:hypothetical protein